MPSGGSNGISILTQDTKGSQIVYLAGQSGPLAAIAAVPLSRGRTSEPAMVKIIESTKVVHIFVDKQENGARKLFGTAINHLNKVDLYTMTLKKNGSVRPKSLQVAALTNEGSVTGILPSLKDNKMHVMIQTASAEHVYIVYSFADDKIVKAMPLTAPTGPLMSMLTHVEPHVQGAFVVPTQKDATSGTSDGLFRATFEDDIEDDSESCDWDHIMESMHIAFMQQESIRFQQSSFPEIESA